MGGTAREQQKLESVIAEVDEIWRSPQGLYYLCHTQYSKMSCMEVTVICRLDQSWVYEMCCVQQNFYRKVALLLQYIKMMAGQFDVPDQCQTALHVCRWHHFYSKKVQVHTKVIRAQFSQMLWKWCYIWYWDDTDNLHKCAMQQSSPQEVTNGHKMYVYSS